MLKNILKIIAIFIIGMVGGIFADQIFWPYFVERPLFYQYRLEKAPIYVTERKEVTVTENVALQNAIEKVKKVVVGVKTETKTKKILEGSGLILTSDGLVVTLADLVPYGSEFSFFVDGTPHQLIGGGQVLKRDLKENLALIKIEKTNLPTAGFANLEKLKLGERVFLVGAAQTPNGGWVVNEGIVKGFDENTIETNIFESINLAGSPLFDIEGNVLGLNTIDKEGRVVSLPVSKIKSFAGF
jgi:serine protease Do